MTIVLEQLSLGQGDKTMMVKDTIDIKGFPTKAGSRALEEAAPATAHAEVIANLLESGWKITGKTNLHELAFGTTGINNWTGTPENPRYPGRVPGGSSSGSAAAVASGLCDAALGTDTGGSVRTPACCCGVFGLKTTFGRVSRKGVMPAYTTLDCVGPFARDIDTIIAAMSAICPDFGPVPEFESLPAKPIGWVPVSAEDEILNTLRDALSRSELSVTDQPLEGMDEAYTAGMNIINRESWNGSRAFVETGLVGPDVADRLLAASKTTDEQLKAAEKVRAAFTATVDAALENCLVLAMPTMPDYPVAVANAADTRALLGMTQFVRPFNLSGHPALTLPLEGPSGLPVGLQLIAAKGADELLCSVARELMRRLTRNR